MALRGLLCAKTGRVLCLTPFTREGSQGLACEKTKNRHPLRVSERFHLCTDLHMYAAAIPWGSLSKFFLRVKDDDAHFLRKIEELWHTRKIKGMP